MQTSRPYPLIDGQFSHRQLRPHRSGSYKSLRLWLLTAALCLVNNISLSAEVDANTAISRHSAAKTNQPTIIHIAVAANFKATLQKLTDEFLQQYPNKNDIDLRIISGSTGTLYAQILHGAPFDIFFAADTSRPKLLIEKNLSDRNNSAVYARGQISWVYAKHKLANKSIDQHYCEHPIDTADAAQQLLVSLLYPSAAISSSHTPQTTVAIANPKTAPYGLAASTFLNRIADDSVSYRLVRGKNIMHAQQLLLNGNVDAAILANSQQYHPQMKDFQFCTIANTLHPSLEQSMIIIKRASRSQLSDDTIKAFYHFVLARQGKAIIGRHGYLTD